MYKIKILTAKKTLAEKQEVKTLRNERQGVPKRQTYNPKGHNFSRFEMLDTICKHNYSCGKTKHSFDIFLIVNYKDSNYNKKWI